MNRKSFLSAAFILLFAVCSNLWAQTPEQLAQDILNATGVKGGLVVHYGCGGGQLTAALADSNAFVVHGLDASVTNIDQARGYIKSLGLYGQVTAEVWSASSLPFAEGSVNLFVTEDQGSLLTSEITRILAPGGIAYIHNGSSWDMTTKPRPAEIDDWKHYLYDSSGNAVSKDTVVGVPKHMQWEIKPKHQRHHDTLASISIMISDGGRVFYIVDEGPTSLTHLPARWYVVARDAFNGIQLWKRAIGSWQSHHYPFREGPFDVHRRLVAGDGKLFVTLDFDEPGNFVHCLDQETGQTITTYPNTAGTREMIYHNGSLLLVTDADNSRVTAIDPNSGAVIWDINDANLGPMQVLTLAAIDDKVFFLTDPNLYCADFNTGQILWDANVPVTAKTTLLAYDDVVLVAYSSKLKAFDIADGNLIWEGAGKSTFRVSPDVFVIDNLIWAGLGALDDVMPLIVQGRDLHTGETVRTIDVNNQELWADVAHHRCHKCKATTKYILTAQRGVEFLDPFGSNHVQNDWIRAVCQHGFIPANGMLYFPPHACACFVKGKLNGFFAMRENNVGPNTIPVALETGAAFGNVTAETPAPDDWPTFRKDIKRSAVTETSVMSGLTLSWQNQLGGQLTAMTSSAGRLYVASKNDYTLHAIDADTGSDLWSFTAGGAIDSPPTIYKGMALFGSTDGHVYCLRASDGELVWKYRIAPDQQRIVRSEKLESVWPIHGSVLVHQGKAYAAAGTSSYLDGGIRICALDPNTGALLHDHTVTAPHRLVPDVSRPDHVRDAARPDVLTTDGTDIYMRMMRFDTQLNKLEGSNNHLFAISSLVDDTWFYRTIWFYEDHTDRMSQFERAKTYYGNGGTNPINRADQGNFTGVAGQMLAFTENRAYGIRARYDNNGQNAQTRGCRIYRKDNMTNRIWVKHSDIQYRAIVLADQALYLAGWDDVDLSDDPFAPIEGRNGGKLVEISTEDGSQIVSYDLEAPPVFDGMIAANGKIYVVLMNGKILSFTGASNTLSVSAGLDQNIYPMQAASLDANIIAEGYPLSDPNDPNSGPLGISCTWSKLAGPGDVNFTDPNAEDTTASFSQSGDYTLRVTASDGSMEAHDDIFIHVAKTADLDKDGDTDIDDAALFFDRWLDADCNNDNDFCFGADQASNGSVDLESLAVIALNWPIASEIPEPNLAAGCVMKLTADVGVTYDASDKVSLWLDQVLNNDASQVDDINKPTFIASAINGHPAIGFDGTDQHLDCDKDVTLNTDAAGYPAKTITVVFKTSADITSRQVLWEQGGGGNGLNFYIHDEKLYISAHTDWGPTNINTSILDEVAYVATMVIDANANNFEAFLNGSSVGVFSPAGLMAKHSGTIGMGHNEDKTKYYDGVDNSTPAPFNGMIAEIYQYNTVLSPAERAILENNLMTKYGISP
jgi:outer membrane protein assembly factor BamB